MQMIHCPPAAPTENFSDNATPSRFPVASTMTTPPDWNDPSLSINAEAPTWFTERLAWPFQSHFTEVNHCPIHYLKWESAPDAARGSLLLVHGGGAHANWWRFIAPVFASDYAVAAIDLSGMGDSGHRDEYSAAERADEMLAVIEAAGLKAPVYVVGHSFGGYMTMRFGVDHGDKVAGAIIVDSPIRRPGEDGVTTPRRALSIERHYPSFEIALERFKLMPPQPCENDYLVEFIARHSLCEREAGWTWKFDVRAMGSRRWSEPFDQHISNISCPTALIYGEHSALFSRDTAAYMQTRMDPATPVVEIPGAHHHIMLDQPDAFCAALQGVLDDWQQA